ncbi:unnamed protein product [Triticum turgidum subsp. durum]|uniref:Uncharacterized protein n=1 Tax=Triticum turgidum subsp. durum TaxID=4567 RepID=A0A9R0VLR7_TRITD|nr:unnamed protein product [Triticum turgidum subsp. durum]
MDPATPATSLCRDPASTPWRPPHAKEDEGGRRRRHRHEGHIVGVRQIAASALGMSSTVLWETHIENLDGLLALEALNFFCSSWMVGPPARAWPGAEHGGGMGGAEPGGRVHGKSRCSLGEAPEEEHRGGVVQRGVEQRRPTVVRRRAGRRGRDAPQWVSDFIDGHTDSWTKEKEMKHFQPPDAQLILNIPLSSRNIDDCPAWHYERIDMFTMRFDQRMLIDMKRGHEDWLEEKP